MRWRQSRCTRTRPRPGCRAWSRPRRPARWPAGGGGGGRIGGGGGRRQGQVRQGVGPASPAGDKAGAAPLAARARTLVVVLPSQPAPSSMHTLVEPGQSGRGTEAGLGLRKECQGMQAGPTKRQGPAAGRRRSPSLTLMPQPSSSGGLVAIWVISCGAGLGETGRLWGWRVRRRPRQPGDRTPCPCPAAILIERGPSGPTHLGGE
jgi:hypothetical protein